MPSFFFFQAEDGIRDLTVTGVQTCALPISSLAKAGRPQPPISKKRLPSSSSLNPSMRSEEHTSELQSQSNLVCRLLLEKKKKKTLMTLTHLTQSTRTCLRETRYCDVIVSEC